MTHFVSISRLDRNFTRVTATPTAASNHNNSNNNGSHRVFYDRHGNSFDEEGMPIDDTTNSNANNGNGNGTAASPMSSQAGFAYRDKRLTQEQYDRHNALLERMRFGGKYWEGRAKPRSISGEIGKNILRNAPSMGRTPRGGN
jgi:hypothetical protein